MRHLLRLLLLAFSVLAACANDFEKQSHISKLRILAVRADPAELIIEPGQQPPKTVLSALAVEPSGALITLQWALCTVQGVVPSPALDCPGTQGIDLFAPDGRGNLDLGQEPFRAQYEALIASPQGQAALATGIPLIIGLTTRTNVAALGALTTVTLRTADPAKPINHNPEIATLEADGLTVAEDGSTTVSAGSTVHLTPIPAEGAHELQADNTFEKLNYSFYATGGEIQTLRSTDTTATGEAADPTIDWLAPTSPGSVQLWVVVRDGRGGQGWVARTVQVK